MRRFRIRRRRALAGLLAPVTALTTTLAATAIATLALTAGIAAGGAATATGEERRAALKPASRSVRIGDRVGLRGYFSGAPKREVALAHRPAGRSGFRPVRSLRTNDRGRWVARVRPRSTGIWRARLVPATDEPQTLSETRDGSGETAAPSADDEGSAPPADGEATRTAAARVRVRSVTRARARQRHVTVGDRVRITGRVRPGGKRQVKVRVGRHTLRTRTDRRGRFSLRWRAPSTGRYRVEARAAGNRIARGSSDRGGRVTVYRPAHASWYGPGFYGNRTACGQTLTTGTLGVAHKTMPCGTKLTLRHRGRSVTVRVIDRGPYVAGREFDLTGATRDRLGFGSTGTVLSSR